MLQSKIKDFWQNNNHWSLLLPKTVALLAIGLIIYTLVSLNNFFKAQQSVLKTDTKQIQTASVEKNFQDITNLHLFESGETKTASTITNLPLTLSGIMINSQGESVAIISENNQPAKAYRVNDTLPGNAKLKEILPNEVIIDRNGKYEKLPLIKSTPQTSSPTKQNSRPFSGPNPRTLSKQSDKEILSNIRDWQKNLIGDPGASPKNISP